MEMTAIVAAGAVFVLLAAAAHLGARAFGLAKEDAEQMRSVARRVAELGELVEQSLERLEAVAGAESVDAAVAEAEGRALDLSAALSALMSYGEGKK